jgi:hypothetical protein
MPYTSSSALRVVTAPRHLDLVLSLRCVHWLALVSSSGASVRRIVVNVVCFYDAHLRALSGRQQEARA